MEDSLTETHRPEKDEYFQVKVCTTIEETNAFLKEIGTRVFFVNPVVVNTNQPSLLFQITYLGD